MKSWSRTTNQIFLGHGRFVRFVGTVVNGIPEISDLKFFPRRFWFQRVDERVCALAAVVSPAAVELDYVRNNRERD